MTLIVKLGRFVYRIGDTVPGTDYRPRSSNLCLGERWRPKCEMWGVIFKATKPRLTHWYSYWNCMITLKQVVFI